MMPDQRLRRRDRLRRQVDFERVYGTDAYAADEVLVVKGCWNRLGYPRLGLAVSRKFGNAVARNRWKRLIRNAFRLTRPEIAAGVDLVVRPRRGAKPVYAEIESSLPRLARRVVRRLEREGGRLEREGSRSRRSRGRGRVSPASVKSSPENDHKANRK